MQFERLFGRRIVPHLLALFHLPVTCHLSGHIPPPPVESRVGWPLSSTPIRHSPPAESLGNRAGRLTLMFPELLRPCSPYDVAHGTPLSSVLRIWVCGLVPWHFWGRDQSMCVCRLYMAWTQAFFCQPLLHMPYSYLGVVWRSVRSVFTRLLTCFLLTFLPPQDMCMCMWSINDPSLKYDSFSPRGDTDSNTKAP